MAFGLVLFLISSISSCRNESTTNADIEIEPSDSTQSPPEPRDSTQAVSSPILSAEPQAPIVDAPETEATGNEPIGFCNLREADNLCIAFTGSDWTDSGARTECSNAPGSNYQSGECSTENRIGTCTIHPSGNENLEMVHSFYAPMNPILAEGICPGRFGAE